MSNKHPNNRPRAATPAEQIAEATRVLDTLKAGRVKLAERAAECAEACKALAYSAHAMHDAEASRDLSAARAEALDVDQRLCEHDHAIVEAERRLQQAHEVEAEAADREEALALRKAVRDFVDAARRVDHALSMLAADGHALIDAHAQMTRLGCQFPSGAQLESLGHISLRAAIMSTPWARTVETVPPGQRSRTFRVLAEGWAANIEANNIRQRLAEQTNKPEAA
jgi:hypothetical protein